MDTTATVTTQPIDSEAFLAGLFDFEPNMLCPLELQSDYFTPCDLRSLTEEFELQKEMIQNFYSILAVSALGQYSLIHETCIYAVARIDGYFRQAQPDEAQEDYQHFSEQVMGEEITVPDRKYRACVNFLDKRYYYTGPTRVTRMIQTTRICAGEFPDIDRIKRLIEEVDAAVQPVTDEDEETALAHYIFTFASHGKIQTRGFAKIGALKLDDLQFLGEMEITEGKLLFYPEGNHSKPIDFSEHLRK